MVDLGRWFNEDIGLPYQRDPEDYEGIDSFEQEESDRN
jgi:hypothetical protein